MATQLSVAARSTARVLTLTLTGRLDGAVVDDDLLRDQVSSAPPAGLVLFDLRAVHLVTAAGLRVLRAVVEALQARGARCCLVAEPAGPVASVLRLALLPPTLLVYGTPDQALRTLEHAKSAATGAAAAASDTLAAQLSSLTQLLIDAPTVGAALRRIVDATASIVPGAALVSITLSDSRGRFFTPVETDTVATALDEAQYRSGQGPCLEALRPDGPAFALSGDLVKERRWPQFTSVARQHGLASVLATDLQTVDRPGGPRGALNIYSRTTNGLTTRDRHTALLLASHAALALAYTSAVELADLHDRQLRAAIETRDVIGQAKGILMSRQGLTADAAFDVLRRTSQDLNVKLVDLARTLADRPDSLD